MNYAEIERFKFTLTNLIRQGCRISLPAYEVDGRLISVGFKPYWTNTSDWKIDRLEFNIMDSNRRVIPFNFNYVTGYDVLSQDGRRFEDSKSISMDIHVYTPDKTREENSGEKVRLDMSVEPIR